MKLTTITILLVFLSNISFAACNDLVFKSVVANINTSPSRVICGPNLHRVDIEIKESSKTSNLKFSNARLYISESSGQVITWVPMHQLGNTNGLYACINPKYISSSYIQVFKQYTENSKSGTNGTSQHKLSLKTVSGQCNLN